MVKLTLRNGFYIAKLAVNGKLRRYATAWRYATGRTTNTDAWNMMHDAEEVVGFWCLEGVGTDSLLEIAAERYGERPELAEVVSRACSRVADKWNSSGDVASAAEDWALDLIHEYLADLGIEPLDEMDGEISDASVAARATA